jgi:hypothetical protein
MPIIVRSIAVLMVSAAHVYAGLTGGPLSVAALRQQSDLIVVATIESIAGSPQGDVVQLRAIRAIEGTLASNQVTVVVPRPGDAIPKAGLLPLDWVSRTGLWFLKTGSPFYEVNTLVGGGYNATDAFLPVTPAALEPPATGTAAQQLLWFQTQWYLSLPKPGNGDDLRVLLSLGTADSADSLAAARLLIASGSPDHVAIGIEVAFRCDSTDAFSLLAANLDLLQRSPKLPRVLGDLPLARRPASEADLPPILSIQARHLTTPGLDSALAGALAHIGTRDAVAALAQLLDSPDPQAQLRAASFFADYALFADAAGNRSTTQVAGPFDSVEVRAYAPRQGSGISPVEYAQFWKGWWTANRTALGFRAP